MSVSEANISRSADRTLACAIAQRLSAIILLGGNVRASGFGEAIGRSILDLPVEKDQTLLAFWQGQAARLIRYLGLERLSMRLMLDREAIEPAATVAKDGVVLSVERDPYAFRGTGGVLRDLSAAYNEDDYLLVANANQLLDNSLDQLAVELAQRNGDVVVMAHRDGTPSGLMLVRCGALRAIPSAGFMDMKEQALPLIARSHDVEVVQKTTASASVIRTVHDYINALRRHHRRLLGISEEPGPFAEDWHPVFNIVENGARAEGARIHDSVVLSGATVEPDAVVVRSVVCRGAVVKKDNMMADAVVK